MDARARVTGSLSIRAASFRAKGSLIFSTSLGRKEGNPATDRTLKPLWIVHFAAMDGVEPPVRLSIFGHLQGRLTSGRRENWRSETQMQCFLYRLQTLFTLSPLKKTSVCVASYVCVAGAYSQHYDHKKKGAYCQHGAFRTCPSTWWTGPTAQTTKVFGPNNTITPHNTDPFSGCRDDNGPIQGWVWQYHLCPHLLCMFSSLPLFLIIIFKEFL